MKKMILILAISTVTVVAFAQKKTTTSGVISFDATTSLDALPKGENKTVIAAIDTKKGSIAFEAIVKNFSFANPMMQEHFNSETWMNSNKFTTATFKGTISNLTSINFGKNGKYIANITGNLTLHGGTKLINTTASIEVKGKQISTNSSFTINLEDYGINGPAIGAGKVSKEPKILVSAIFKK